MPRTPGLRYLLASLCLGLVAFWASENFFWAAPNSGTTVPDMAMTWIAYSLCSAAALSAALASGLGGWRALFLGGGLLGWLVEGVIVGTTYEVFPFQLVWTPLAWHALITALAVGSLCRAGPHWPVTRQLAGLVGLGLFGAGFAQFWPTERGAMPGVAPVFVYIAGVGLVVPLANILLDRLDPLMLPKTWVLWLAPACLAVLWAIQSAAAPGIVRLTVPALIALTFLTMHRLGTEPRQHLDLGRPAPVWRHLLFLIAPLVMVPLQVLGWSLFPSGILTNIPTAVATVTLSLGLWLWLVIAALRRPTPDRPPRLRF